MDSEILDNRKKRKLQLLDRVVTGKEIALTQHLSEIEDLINGNFQKISEELADMDEEIESKIESIDIPEQESYPESVEVSNFPTIQKVEITNFPEHKEDKPPIVNVPAPIVNVPAPIVNVEAPEVTIDTEKLNQSLGTVSETLSEILKNIPANLLEGLIKDGRIKVEVDRVGGGVISFPIVEATAKGAYLSGQSSANGTRDLTSANTWYAVPSTVPSQPYVLVVTQENASGTIRWGFDNTGTPSATNGNQAPSQLTVKLAANQVLYFASSTAGDDVNWTTKII